MTLSADLGKLIWAKDGLGLFGVGETPITEWLFHPSWYDRMAAMETETTKLMLEMIYVKY